MSERSVVERLYFGETAAYNAVASGRKTLVIGRRGVGKSAICVRLASRSAYAGGVELVTMGEGLRHGGRTPGAVKELKDFLKTNRALFGDPGTAGGFGRWLQGLSGGLSVEAFGVKATADFARRTTATEEDPRPAQRLTLLEDCVRHGFAELGCAPDHTFVLLVDRLEHLWCADVESHSFFIRSDIYDSLKFVEGDKFRSDELRIDWTESDLKDLALRRARASGGAELTADRLWGEIFPPSVCGKNTLTYLLTRVLPRPRDLIQYLNECQHTAIGNGHRDRVHESDIELATQRFSQWKLKDLVQEYLVAHPFLERLLPLFQNAGYVVTRAALTRRVELVEDALRHEFPAYKDALTPDGILNTLHAVGFLGVRRGNGVVYAGIPLLPVQPHEDEFHVHPCFRAALGATSPTGLDPYDRRVASSIRAQVLSGGLVAEGAIRAGREHRLLERLARACRSVLGELAHADTVPDVVRDEIATQVRRVLALAEGAHPLEKDVERTVLDAAAYFHTLAVRLRQDRLEGDTGPESLTAALSAHSTRLTRAVGGGTGSSGEA